MFKENGYRDEKGGKESNAMFMYNMKIPRILSEKKI